MSILGGIQKALKPQYLMIVASAAILFSFQNCAPLTPQCAEDTEDAGCALASQTPESAEQPNSPTSTNSSSTPGLSVPGTTGSSNTGNGVSLPGGSTGSGSGGGSGGVSLPGDSGGSTGGSTGSVNFQDKTFRIIEQPVALSVPEGGSGSLVVSIFGGTTPYSYQWYKDGSAISFGIGSSFGILADRPSREGLYSVTVKDATGISVSSQQVRVSITEVPGDCSAGAYAALLNDTTALTGESIRDLFVYGANKYLQSVSHPAINYLYNNQRYLGSTYIQIFNVSSAVKYKGLLNIACSSPISQIHTPTNNPGAGYDEGGWSWNNNYSDGYGYRWNGTVTFECVNKKYRLLANTCQWYKIPVQDSF